MVDASIVDAREKQEKQEEENLGKIKNKLLSPPSTSFPFRFYCMNQMMSRCL